MKKQIVFNERPLFWVILIVILPLFGACEKEDDGFGDDAVPISTIPRHDEYASQPLIYTRWHFIGFANAKTGRIRRIDEELLGNGNFIVVFDEDGKISGKASANQVHGEFELTGGRNNIAMTRFQNITEAGEHPDGYLFIDAMKEVNRYSIGSRGLALYYDSNSYLLFAPLIYVHF